MSFLLAALVSVSITCQNIDDTATLQSAVDQHERISIIDQQCKIDMSKGVFIPSNRNIDADSSTFTAIPGCVYRCRMFETAVGAVGVRFAGGTIIGDLDNFTGLQWKVGWKVNSATDVEIVGTAIRRFRQDCVWVGGNPPGSRNVLLSGLDLSEFGRNGISASSVVGLRIENSSIHDVVLAPGQARPDPGAGIDIEPNPAEQVTDLGIERNKIWNVRKGIFVQPGHGYPCERCWVEENDVADTVAYLPVGGEWGIAVNSVIGGGVTRNRVRRTPLGITIGGATEATRARNLIVADNDVDESVTGLRMAGVRDSEVVRNIYSGLMTKPALGDAGDMLYRGNAQR